MIPTVHEVSSSAVALSLAPAGRPLELLEARTARDGLRTLLGAERNAAAEFLLALADFDRRRGWESLGYASLFGFLEAELRLSKGAAFLRFSAAKLLQRHPEVIEPLRDGRLCLSSVGELARVLKQVDLSVALPRFFGCSSREAKEVAASLCPIAQPLSRDLVTRVAPPRSTALQLNAVPAEAVTHVPGLDRDAPVAVHAHELNAPVRVPDRREEVEPLTADLRRLHVTVGARLLKKLDAARDGLSHAIPNASMEQVLEAALDSLLEKQAKARGEVKKPRAVAPAPDPAPEPAPVHHRRAGLRAAIPAAVRRAVWERDGGRCCWPLDGGGTCGSTHQLELDHVVPWARGGEATVANLRVVCRAHNRAAARAFFGAKVSRRYGSS
jgi:hypothetical protein